MGNKLVNWLAALGFVFAAPGVFAQGGDMNTSDKQAARIARDLDVSLAHVWSGGYWQEGERWGFFRFVVTTRGYEHVANRMFVQWIEQFDQNTTAQLVAQRPLTQINDPGIYVFGVPQCVGAAQCTTLELEVQHTYTGERQKLFIRLKGPGEYEANLVK